MKNVIQQLRKELIKKLSQFYNCFIAEDESGRLDLPKSQKEIAQDIGIRQSRLSRLLYPKANDPNTPGSKQYRNAISKLNILIPEKEKQLAAKVKTPLKPNPSKNSTQAPKESTSLSKPTLTLYERIGFYLKIIIPLLILTTSIIGNFSNSANVKASQTTAAYESLLPNSQSVLNMLETYAEENIDVFANETMQQSAKLQNFYEKGDTISLTDRIIVAAALMDVVKTQLLNVRNKMDDNPILMLPKNVKLSTLISKNYPIETLFHMSAEELAKATTPPNPRSAFDHAIWKTIQLTCELPTNYQEVKQQIKATTRGVQQKQFEALSKDLDNLYEV